MLYRLDSTVRLEDCPHLKCQRFLTYRVVTANSPGNRRHVASGYCGWLGPKSKHQFYIFKKLDVCEFCAMISSHWIKSHFIELAII